MQEAHYDFNDGDEYAVCRICKRRLKPGTPYPDPLPCCSATPTPNNMICLVYRSFGYTCKKLTMTLMMEMSTLYVESVRGGSNSCKESVKQLMELNIDHTREY